MPDFYGDLLASYKRIVQYRVGEGSKKAEDYVKLVDKYGEFIKNSKGKEWPLLVKLVQEIKPALLFETAIPNMYEIEDEPADQTPTTNDIMYPDRSLPKPLGNLYAVYGAPQSGRKHFISNMKVNAVAPVGSVAVAPRARQASSASPEEKRELEPIASIAEPAAEPVAEPIASIAEPAAEPIASIAEPAAEPLAEREPKAFEDRPRTGWAPRQRVRARERNVPKSQTRRESAEESSDSSSQSSEEKYGSVRTPMQQSGRPAPRDTEESISRVTWDDLGYADENIMEEDAYSQTRSRGPLSWVSSIPSRLSRMWKSADVPVVMTDDEIKRALRHKALENARRLMSATMFNAPPRVILRTQKVMLDKGNLEKLNLGSLAKELRRGEYADGYLRALGERLEDEWKEVGNRRKFAQHQAQIIVGINDKKSKEEVIEYAKKWIASHKKNAPAPHFPDQYTANLGDATDKLILDLVSKSFDAPPPKQSPVLEAGPAQEHAQKSAQNTLYAIQHKYGLRSNAVLRIIDDFGKLNMDKLSRIYDIMRDAEFAPGEISAMYNNMKRDLIRKLCITDDGRQINHEMHHQISHYINKYDIHPRDLKISDVWGLMSHDIANFASDFIDWYFIQFRDKFAPHRIALIKHIIDNPSNSSYAENMGDERKAETSAFARIIKKYPETDLFVDLVISAIRAGTAEETVRKYAREFEKCKADENSLMDSVYAIPDNVDKTRERRALAVAQERCAKAEINMVCAISFSDEMNNTDPPQAAINEIVNGLRPHGLSTIDALVELTKKKIHDARQLLKPPTYRDHVREEAMILRSKMREDACIGIKSANIILTEAANLKSGGSQNADADNAKSLIYAYMFVITYHCRSYPLMSAVKQSRDKIIRQIDAVVSSYVNSTDGFELYAPSLRKQYLQNMLAKIFREFYKIVIPCLTTQYFELRPNMKEPYQILAEPASVRGGASPPKVNYRTHANAPAVLFTSKHTPEELITSDACAVM